MAPSVPGIAAPQTTLDAAIVEQLANQTRLLWRIDKKLGEMNLTLGQIAGAHSSVEISQTARGEYRPTIKAYEGSPLGHLVPQALEALAETQVRLARAIEAGWEETLTALRLERARDEAEFDE